MARYNDNAVDDGALLEACCGHRDDDMSAIVTVDGKLLV